MGDPELLGAEAGKLASSEVSVDEGVTLFNLMNHLNEDGNNLTRAGNYKLAIDKYKQAL